MRGIGQSTSRTVVNGELSLRRLKLLIYEVVTPREEEEDRVRGRGTRHS